MKGSGGESVINAGTASKSEGVTGQCPAPVVVLDRFELCLPFTLKEEGGFDPSGPSFMGITLATYQHWMDNPGLTIADLKKISTLRVAAIYETEYWDVSRAPLLPIGVDLSVFDMAVNAGPGRSIRLLQGAIGTKEDGIVGPKTLAAIHALNPVVLLRRLYNEQNVFYHGLANFPKFGAGWLARCTARWHAAEAQLPSAQAARV